MKGDVIIVEPHHRRAAEQIVERLYQQVHDSRVPVCIAVAGESGSGKSETGQAIKEAFNQRNEPAFVFQQDDYFVLPPRSNDRKRREDIGWVGTGEVRIDLLDSHLELARRRATGVTKPLVDYAADRIDSEAVDLDTYSVFIAEGTYTSLLQNLDVRVFIARNRLDTLDSRRKRAREAIEPFIEQVLEIEHGIIAPHRDLADIIVERDYAVSFRTP